MQMYFYWDYIVKDYLFSGLSTQSVGGLVGLSLCVASISFLFEFLRYLQARQRQKELTIRSTQLMTICPTDTSSLLTGEPSTSRGPEEFHVTMRQKSVLYGAEISLWFILLNLGYFLMLSVMRYNGWLFLSAVIGGGLGYFIFGQMFMKINLQNCHIIRATWCMHNCGISETVPASRDGESTPALEATRASTSALNCHQVPVSVHTECHK